MRYRLAEYRRGNNALLCLRLCLSIIQSERIKRVTLLLQQRMGGHG